MRAVKVSMWVARMSAGRTHNLILIHTGSFRAASHTHSKNKFTTKVDSYCLPNSNVSGSKRPVWCQVQYFILRLVNVGS